jgi:hypothetical protein
MVNTRFNLLRSLILSAQSTRVIMPNHHTVTSTERYEASVKLQSGFFSRLPLEIRDVIYGKIWGDADTTSQRSQRIGYDMAYDGGNDPLDFSVGTEANRTNWLLTNKQMMTEGIHQLYRKSTCHLNDGDNAISSRPDASQLLRSLQVLSYAIYLQHEPFIFDGEQRSYRMNSAVRTQINRTIGWAGSTSPVKSFQIHVKRPFQEPALARTKADFKFDLQHLESLKKHENLNRFEVHILCDMDDAVMLSAHWRVNSTTHARCLEDHYFATLRAEIIRVGQFLIEGGKKSGYMKETTRESDGIWQLSWGWIFEKP